MYSLGRIDEAIRMFRNVLDLKPLHVQSRFFLALAFEHQGNLAEAIQEYRQAIHLDPGNAEAHARLGYTLRQQGDLGEALSSFERAVELDPNSAYNHWNLVILLFTSDRERAIASLQRIIVLNPDHAEAYNLFGVAYYEMEDFDQAMDYFERAVELQPKQARFYYNLALVLRARGFSEAAVSYYKESQRLDPTLEDPHRLEALRRELEPDSESPLQEGDGFFEEQFLEAEKSPDSPNLRETRPQVGLHLTHPRIDLRSTRPMPEYIGRTRAHWPTIPGYTILRELGRGGAGYVFLAKSTDTGKAVAIKILTELALANPIMRARFEREAEAMRQLNHPNIVRIEEYNVTDRFLVMEYVPGKNLSFWIKQDLHQMEIGDRERVSASILLRCLEALEVVHAVGLIHRDLKPENIFMDEDGNPKLGDFGIVRPMAQQRGITLEDNRPGSPLYIPPENIYKSDDPDFRIDIRGDLYSLGTVAFEMVTGRPPHEERTGEGVQDYLLRKIVEPSPNPRTKNPEISESLAAIIFKAISKDRGQRYQTPTEFREDLEAFLEGRPLVHA